MTRSKFLGVGMVGLLLSNAAAMPAAHAQLQQVAPVVVPGTDDGLAREIMYDAPLAHVGAMSVFRSTLNRFVRTVPLRVAQYDVRDEGRKVAVYLNLKPTDLDFDIADLQVRQSLGEERGERVSVKAMVPIMPDTIQVSLFDPSGKLLGTVSQDASSADENVSVPFEFVLSPALEDASRIASYSVSVRAESLARQAVASFGSHELVARDIVNTIERILGLNSANPNDKPKPQDYITRDVVDRLYEDRSLVS